MQLRRTWRVCGNPYCVMCYGDSARRLIAGRTIEAVQPIPQPLATSPQPVIDSALRELQLTTADVFYDLGCGDGRVVIEAAKRYGCRAVGIELDPQLAKTARDAVRAAGLTDSVNIYRGDATKCDVTEATAAYLYLDPATASEVAERLPPRCRVASYSHDIPNTNHRVVVGDHGPIYFRLGD